MRLDLYQAEAARIAAEQAALLTQAEELKQETEQKCLLKNGHE